MPRFSAFTRFGNFRFSSRPTNAELVFRALVKEYGEAFDLTWGNGGTKLAQLYAAAMAIGRARDMIERARRQKRPHTAREMLPSLERDYLVSPTADENVWARAAALEDLLPQNRGATQEAIEDALRRAAGDGFVFYRPTPDAEAVQWPATPGTATGPGNYPLPDAPQKFFTLVGNIVTVGTAKRFIYQSPFGEALVPGDFAVFQTENEGLAERVKILPTAITTDLFKTKLPKGQHYATAVFTKSHDTGATIRTGAVPLLFSSHRFSLVILTPAAATDPEVRRKVNEAMRRHARGVSQWQIVETTGPRQVGPLVVGVSPIGRTPVETVRF